MFGDVWMQCGSDPFDPEYEDNSAGWGDDYTINPLHHHTLVYFDYIKKSTQKAYLFVIEGEDFWFPKRWVRELRSKERTCYIWRKGFNLRMDEWEEKESKRCNVRSARV